MSDQEITRDEVMTGPIQTSVEVDQVFAALVAAQGQVGDVPMRGVNPHFRSNYVTLEDALKECRPVLAKNGLGIIAGPFAENGCFGAAIRIIHKSGQWIEVSGKAKSSRGGIQEMGSILTYLRRYAICGALNIAGDSDDDGESSEGRGSKKGKAPKRSAPKPPPVQASDEEYAQMGEVLEDIITQKPTGKKITQKQRGRLFAKTREAEGNGGVNEAALKIFLQTKFQITSTTDIPMSIYDSVCEWVDNSPRLAHEEGQ